MHDTKASVLKDKKLRKNMQNCFDAMPDTAIFPDGAEQPTSSERLLGLAESVNGQQASSLCLKALVASCYEIDHETLVSVFLNLTNFSIGSTSSPRNVLIKSKYSDFISASVLSPLSNSS